MVKHMKYKGKTLKKPNIAFNVRAKGQSYLEWAEDVHQNSFLSQKWKWTQLVDAKGTVIQTTQQNFEDRRGEWIRYRWAGQTEAELAVVEKKADEEHSARKKLEEDKSHHQGAEKRKPEDDEKELVPATNQKAVDLKKHTEELFDIICGELRPDQTDKPPSLTRSELKMWLTDPKHFQQISDKDLLTRMSIFDQMEPLEQRPVHEEEQHETPGLESQTVQSETFSNASHASEHFKPNETWSPSQTQRQAGKQMVQNQARSPKMSPQQSSLNRLIIGIIDNDTITKDNFVELCHLEREFLLPFELQELVPLEEALRHFGDKLLAIFCDVVKGVVNRCVETTPHC